MHLGCFDDRINLGTKGGYALEYDDHSGRLTEVESTALRRLVANRNPRDRRLRPARPHPVAGPEDTNVCWHLLPQLIARTFANHQRCLTDAKAKLRRRRLHGPFALN